MTFAIVPACGSSMRMGRPKLTLPLGESTVLGRVVATLREGGVDRILVVVGPHVPELVQIAEAAGADVLALEDPTPNMRTTVECGLAWLEGKHFPGSADYWLLAPADHPAFPASVVRELLSESGKRLAPIIVPTFNGRRGHPTLFRWNLVTELRSLLSHEGINSLLKRHAKEVVELAVAEPGILANLDTPEDYERIRRDYS